MEHTIQENSTKKPQTFLVNVTPEMARQMIQKNASNRIVRPLWVNELVNRINCGQWKLTHQGIAFDKTMNLLDGQHRLLACIKANKTIPLMVTYGADKESMCEIDNGKNRTAADVLSIKHGIRSKRVAASIKYYLTIEDAVYVHKQLDFGSSGNIKANSRDILSVYEKHTELCSRIQTDADRYNNNFMPLKPMFIGGMMLYLIINKGYSFDYVTKFFSELCTGQKITNDSLIIYRNILTNNAVSQKKMSSKLLSILFTKMWNAYKSGRVYRKSPSLNDVDIPTLI